MKLLYDLLIKRSLEQILTVLVAENKREDNMTCKKFTERWVNALASASKGM